MLRVVVAFNGRVKTDMTAGNCDIIEGLSSTYNSLDGEEYVFFSDGAVLREVGGTGSWLKNRELLAVTL